MHLVAARVIDAPRADIYDSPNGVRRSEVGIVYRNATRRLGDMRRCVATRDVTISREIKMDKVKPEAMGYARLKPTRKTGDEHFYQYNPTQSLDLKLIEFWRWLASDLVSNATRGILAEYIVAHALGLADCVRAEWDAYDLLLPTESKPEGVKIEVKSASYLQSWFHKELSVISFNISPTRVWDADTNTIAIELKRQADVYVFCLLGHKEKETLDPLNLSQWEFYVLPTTVLNGFVAQIIEVHPF